MKLNFVYGQMSMMVGYYIYINFRYGERPLSFSSSSPPFLSPTFSLPRQARFFFHPPPINTCRPACEPAGRP